MLVFWVVTPCGLIGRHQSFGRNEDGSGMFLLNVGIYHAVTTHKTNIDIFTAVRTSNLLQLRISHLRRLQNDPNHRFSSDIFKFGNKM
jgi:hypothetical protein